MTVLATTPALEEAPCDLCGKGPAVVLYDRQLEANRDGAFAATTDEFLGHGRIVRCGSCGLAWQSPRPTAEWLAGAYRDTEDPLYLEEAPGRRASARRILRRLARVAPPGRLLDVGCDAGFLLEEARSPWKPEGLELSAWAARMARERTGAPVRETTLEAAGYDADTFDAVTMLDVIEHVPSPSRLVAQVHRILKPGGSFYVLTPDLGAPVARLMGRWWWGLRPAHLTYFTRATLRALVEKAGFEVVSVRHEGRRFTFGYWISRMRGYAPPFVDAAGWLARVTRAGRLPLYMNTFDSVGMYARRRTA